MGSSLIIIDGQTPWSEVARVILRCTCHYHDEGIYKYVGGMEMTRYSLAAGALVPSTVFPWEDLMEIQCLQYSIILAAPSLSQRPPPTNLLGGSIAANLSLLTKGRLDEHGSVSP